MFIPSQKIDNKYIEFYLLKNNFKSQTTQVLNETLRSELDMSTLTKDMIQKMPHITSKASNTTTTTTNVTSSSDYSSGDFTSSSSSPLGGNHKLGGNDDGILSSTSGGESDNEATKKVTNYILFEMNNNKNAKRYL